MPETAAARDPFATLLGELEALKQSGDFAHVAPELARLERSLVQALTRPVIRVAGGAEPLSTRELHVLGFVADGLSNKQVARRLGISEKTVRNHLTRIFKKLGVVTRTQAVVNAMHSGLLPL